MGLRHYVLTFTGVAQRLSDVYGDGVGIVNAAHDIPYRQLLLQSVDTNTQDVYIGANAQVTSTNFGFHLDATQAVVPVTLGPFEAGPIKLSDIWVIGTLNEKVTVLGVPY